MNDLTSKIDVLAKRIFDDLYHDDPFDDIVREEKALKDIVWMLKFIHQGFIVQNFSIVYNLVVWLRKLFVGLKIDVKHVEYLYESTRKILREALNDQALNEFLVDIDFSSLTVDAKHATKNPLQKEMNQYLELLLASKRVEAIAYIHDLIEKGISIENIYLHIFQETMVRVGELWHEGTIDVGREHYCTALTQYIMSTLYPYILGDRKENKKLLACAVGSELHELGIRMVADIFELHHWDTRYLGASVPIPSIVSAIKDYQPDVVALSITMSYHISLLKETIESIRKEVKDVKIIVGGRPFLEHDDIASFVGADAFAFNAKEGIHLANQFTQ